LLFIFYFLFFGLSFSFKDQKAVLFHSAIFYWNLSHKVVAKEVLMLGDKLFHGTYTEPGFRDLRTLVSL